jgi:hypothetical protein
LSKNNRRPAFLDAKTVIRAPFFEVATEVSTVPERMAREFEQGQARPPAVVISPGTLALIERAIRKKNY